MVSGNVLLAILISEAAPRVPADEPAEVRPQFLSGWISQFSALRVIPEHLVRIVWVLDRLIRFEHPSRNRAEVNDRAVAFGCA